MKKLFENQIIHFSVVLMIVALACGLLIGAVNSVTAPIIEDNKIKAELEAYEEVLPGIASFEVADVTGEDPSTVSTKIIGLDNEGNVIGFIYVVGSTNRYGNMIIVISVGLDDKVIGAKFLEINQTLGVNDTRSNLQQFVGKSINDSISKGDLISGVTGSTTTLMSLMADAAKAHSLMDLDLYKVHSSKVLKDMVLS